MASIGALESLMDLAKTVVQPVFGAASDVYGRKRFLVLREALILGAGVCFLLAQSWWLLALGMTLIGFSVALYPVYSSLVAESSEGHEMGLIYSVMGSSYIGLGLMGTLAAGYMADTYGYSSVYSLFTLLAAAALAVTVFKIHETRSPKKASGFTLREAFGSFLDTFRPPRYLWGFYVAMSVDLFAFSMGWRLINGMLTESFGYTPYMLGILGSASLALQTVLQVVFGRYVDRFGYVRYLAASQSISCCLMALMLWNQSFAAALAANLMMGASAALWSPAEQAWIAKNTDPGERGKSIGGYNTFRGLVALPAPIIGGILYDGFGFHLPLTINLVLAIVDVGLLVFMVKEKARPWA
jgi:DHA1 family tetracycline resistance protein-like MFS transporter